MLETSSMKGKKIAIYGLGTETDRFISEHGNELDIVCLLDGFRTEGELYSYEIWPVEKAISFGVQEIIVVARPGSCKAISKRIGDICRSHNVSLMDVRGNDLLAVHRAVFDYGNLFEKYGDEIRKTRLLQKIDSVDVVSFDLFDTLVTRKVFEYTDVFALVDERLRHQGIIVEDFAAKRLAAEKELSKGKAPRLEEIYEQVLESVDNGLAKELVDIEWNIDSSLIVPREGMKELVEYCVERGKKVFVTTDCYYSKERVVFLLNSLGFVGFEDVMVSCEYGVGKCDIGKCDVMTEAVHSADEDAGYYNDKADSDDQVLGLYGKLAKKSGDGRIIHIGDDEYADVECLKRFNTAAVKKGLWIQEDSGIESFRIFSGRDLFYALGGLGLEDKVVSSSDRVKMGLVIAKMFSNPFCFEYDETLKLSINSTENLGYICIGALIADFTHWFRDKVKSESINEILFCARDGYLLQKLYEKIDSDTSGKYFLTSRTAAIRAGMESEEDIAYVDSMHFFGSEKDALAVRFGLKESDEGKLIDDISDIAVRNKIIINKSQANKRNYLQYIADIGAEVADGGNIAVFDFVAKGTTQLFIQKLFAGHLKGLYFLQLEPEFMKDKGLDIVSFYGDAERDSSTIFDDYYILETIITSPDPSVDEFDDSGKPIYAEETRPQDNIDCAMEVQKGIEAFWDDYISLVPEYARMTNKPLDEALLSMIKKVQIADEKFYGLVIEDPFFGRMTDIKDVL